MPDDVRFVQSDGLAVADAFPNDYHNVAVMSNHLEHLDSAKIVIEHLRVAQRVTQTG